MLESRSIARVRDGVRDLRAAGSIERVGIPAAQGHADLQRRRHASASSRAAARERALLPAERFPPAVVVVGSVTRFDEIKDPLNLVRGVHRDAPAADAARHERCASLMIGDGPLRAAVEALLERGGRGREPRGCRAAATTSRRCCAQWTCSCSARCAREFRTRCSRRWRSGLPVVASGDRRQSRARSSTARPACWCRRAIRRRSPRRLLPTRATTRMRARTARRRARAPSSEYSLRRMLVGLRRALYALHCKPSTETA